ncbi:MULTISPECIES: hypothetical protein [unclassified Bartonella]|uniref:hypothetical protein n=1 Tax=unclassified Bartonella TaxID=2645622 RepID=UPI00236031B4|nr:MULTISPECIES: hypothetical protein [unclassified Bartonella]
MQEWINIFLTGFLSFIASLLVALILRHKDKKGLEKQFIERDKQTVALEKIAMYSEQNVKILLKDKDIRTLKELLHIEADFDLLETEQGISRIAIRMHITNLANQAIVMRKIKISEKNLFKFCIRAIVFPRYLDPFGDILSIIRTTNKHVNLYLEDIKSNTNPEFASNLFVIPAHKYTAFDLLINCPEDQTQSVADFTLDYTLQKNPDELITADFWTSSAHTRQTYNKILPGDFFP